MEDEYLKISKYFAQHSAPANYVAYLASDNPLFVWRTYQILRRGGHDVPPWIFEYFDSVAAGLEDGLSSKEALGIGSKGGPDAFSRADKTIERIST